MKIPFSPPRIDERTIEAVAGVLRSGWITTGPRVKRFEEMITEYTGCGATVCLNSASAGLELVLRWFGVGPGDEVIVPAYTYSASANVVVHCGATPVFVDSGPDFNLDPAAVGRAITPRTKVVMPVDIGGWPCDYAALWEAILSPAALEAFVPATEAQHKLGRILMLADAAHSFGAVYQGRRIGTAADISVFSFHAVKNLTTAEGGAVCLNLPDVFKPGDEAAGLRTKSLHGQSKDAFSKMNNPGWRYDILEPGYKCNMTDIQAAMGIVELERYEEQLDRRRKIMERYDAAFSGDPRFTTPRWKDGDSRSSFHLYMLRLNNISEALRDAVIASVFAREVAVNVHFVPLPMMTYYRNAGYDIKDYPGAYQCYACEISLPVYYDLSPEMQELVIASLFEALNEHGLQG